MKDIAVIIVSWNACCYLRDCLHSIRSTGDAVVREVVVVDNASTDGSQEMVATEFPEVILVRSKENLGFAKANNLGLKCTSAPFLAFVNSDVIVHPGCFEGLRSYLSTHHEVGLAGPKVYGADGLLQRTCRRLPTLWNTTCRSLALDSLLPNWPLFSGREMRHWNHENLAEVEVLSGCFWMARREAVEEVGVLDERFFFYAEDVDWCKRFRDAGWRVQFMPAASATHFGGASSSNAPLRYSIELLRANLTYWRKHHAGAGWSAFYCLSVLHHAVRFICLSPVAVARKISVSETPYNFRRSMVCLRWLLTGREI